MKGTEWIKIMEQAFPGAMAQDWDNVGLLCGDADREVGSVYIALDATTRAVEEAVRSGADILLTHHPLIFSPMKRVVSDDYVGKRLIKIIEGHMIYYAVHTNYDARRMARIASGKLGLKDDCPLEPVGDEGEGIGRTGALERPMTLKACAGFVKERFHIPDVRFFGDPDRIVKRVSVCPGSGRGMEDAAASQGSDVLIAGDFGHHDGIDALEKGIAVIDAGHYGLEHVFVEDMARFIREHCPGLTCFTETIRYPFQTV